MDGIVSDNDVQGQVAILLQILGNEEWREIWDYLELKVFELADLSLKASAPDNAIWDACQRIGVVLITGNRNNDGPTSLEETIRNQNSSSALPVFTLSDPQRIKRDRKYANRVAESLLRGALGFF